jgi:hypothetical protein
MWSKKRPDTTQAADAEPTSLQTKPVTASWEGTTKMNEDVMRPAGRTADLAPSRLGRRESLLKFLFLASVPFAISLVGCNDACFSFTSNPPAGTIGITVSDPAPACRFAKANGTVRVVMEEISAAGSSLGPSPVQHVFVTLRGVDVHPSPITDDASPDWQELLPHLSHRPLQIDLLSPAEDARAQHQIAEPATIPAGTYHQLRLRFVENQPAVSDAVPEKNGCGSAAYNCLVSQDGRIQPLVFDHPELRITSENIPNGSLLIVPDSAADLVLTFRASWSFSSSDGVRLLPRLTATASLER